MMNTNLEQFLSRFLIANYILSPETITHKVAVFQAQQTDSSTTPSLGPITNLPPESGGDVISPDQGLSSTRAWERG